MMPGARLVGVVAVRAANAVRRAGDHRRALVVRLVDQHAVAAIRIQSIPRAYEFLAVALRTVAREELAFLLDAGGDEVVAGLLEDRAPLVAVGLQQPIATPTLQRGGQLPAEIGHVLEPVVEAETAIGRMAVGGVAGDEHAP